MYKVTRREEIFKIKPFIVSSPVSVQKKNKDWNEKHWFTCITKIANTGNNFGNDMSLYSQNILKYSLNFPIDMNGQNVQGIN